MLLQNARTLAYYMAQKPTHADLEVFTSLDGPAGSMQHAIINNQDAFHRQLLLFPTPPVHVHP